MDINWNTHEYHSIRAMHQRVESLLHVYREPLGRKNVWSMHRLMQIIKLDLFKLTRALMEVKELRSSVLLETLFQGQSETRDAIARSLSDSHLYHLGFEVHEPLDLMLNGIHLWNSRTRMASQIDLKVHRLQRFPASEAFQKRVGAPAEIMRIWIEVAGRALMLELFDIERPVDACLSGALPRLTHRNFDCLLAETVPDRLSPGDPLSESVPDDIWHYALDVRTLENVQMLHRLLRELAKRRSEYVLAYADPVANDHDGSLHTKVIHQKLGLELELVAQR